MQCPLCALPCLTCELPHRPPFLSEIEESAKPELEAKLKEAFDCYTPCQLSVAYRTVTADDRRRRHLAAAVGDTEVVTTTKVPSDDKEAVQRAKVKAAAIASKPAEQLGADLGQSVAAVDPDVQTTMQAIAMVVAPPPPSIPPSVPSPLRPPTSPPKAPITIDKVTESDSTVEVVMVADGTKADYSAEHVVSIKEVFILVCADMDVIISSDDIRVSIEDSSRRLQAVDQRLRRQLASGVTITVTIVIPSGSPASTADIRANLVAQQDDLMQSLIDAGIAVTAVAVTVDDSGGGRLSNLAIAGITIGVVVPSTALVAFFLLMKMKSKTRVKVVTHT